MIIGAKLLRQDYMRMVNPFREKYRFNGLSGGLGPAGYDIALYLEKGKMILWSGEFMLAASVEYFDMPVGVMGIVHDKSTLARQGIAVQNTVIEPGWRGHLTLELTNHGKKSVDLEHGQPIAQVVFHLVVGAEPYDGSYQDQEEGPQEARQYRPPSWPVEFPSPGIRARERK